MSGRDLGRRVLVAGSINMDLVVRAPRHPRPGETILGDTFQTFPGGKGANQAVAAARLGGHAVLVAMLGDDAHGDSLAAFLRDESVETAYVGRTTGATGIGCIVIDSDSQNTIVVVPGANARLSPADVRRVAVSPGDILVSQFEIPIETVTAFFDHGKEHGGTTLLNPSPAQPCPPSLLHRTDILVLNETEAALVAGRDALDPDDVEEVERVARRLQVRESQVVVVTLGDRGAVAVADGARHYVPARRVHAVDPTGAGDCFVGGFAVRWTAGDTLLGTLEYASVASSLCVQKMGAAPSLPTAAAVDAALQST